MVWNACLPPSINQGLSVVPAALSSCHLQGFGGRLVWLVGLPCPKYDSPANPSPWSEPISHFHGLLPDLGVGRQESLSPFCLRFSSFVVFKPSYACFKFSVFIIYIPIMTMCLKQYVQPELGSKLILSKYLNIPLFYLKITHGILSTMIIGILIFLFKNCLFCN